MAYTGYVNEAVRKMYSIPYKDLTAGQKKILHEDSLRRAKLIDDREQDVLKNNLKAFEDEAKMEKVLASIYNQCQKDILADVAETMAKVKKAGGEWSYANQSALTRSRGLFEQITAELNKLGQKESLCIDKGLSNIYTDQFLREVYSLGQSINVKANFNRLNPALIRKTLDYPWSGAMFSDRLWLDKEQLGKNLRIGLTQSMVLGESMDQISDRIRKNIDTVEYNSMRIARTETKRVSYVAHVDAFKDTGVSRVMYRIANGGDHRVCSVCRGDNGKEYNLGEEPTLPRHPNCRCVYIPVVEDTFSDNELNELTGSVRGAENYEKWEKAQKEKLLQEKDIKLQDGKDNDIIDTKGEVFTGALGKEIRSSFDGGSSIRGNMSWDDYKEKRLQELYDQKKLLTDPKYIKQCDAIIKNHEEYKQLCSNPKGVILEMQSSGTYKLSVPPSQHIDEKVRNSEYYNRYSLIESSYTKYNYDIYEERLDGKYYITMKGVSSKKEKEEIYKICDNVFNQNTRAIGAKVRIDTAECNKKSTRRSTNLGFYTPSQHKLTVRTFKSYNEVYGTTGDAGRDYFAGTVAHEFAHIVHSKDSRLAKVVADTTQWDSWKDLIEPYYVQYRENKLIDFNKDWHRFSYPINSQDHYSDHSKDHYYQEVWAEATAVIQESVAKEKKAEEIAKLRKYFPKVLEFVTAFYGGGV